MTKELDEENNGIKKKFLQEPLRFLHEPIRLQIIAQLYSVKQTDMIFLKKNLNLTWGNLSFHSSKLEEKGYVIITKKFIGKKPYTLIEITKEGIEQFEKYKDFMHKFLN